MYKRSAIDMAKITLKEFFESKDDLAIHCDTFEKAIKLCKKFRKISKIWKRERHYLKGTDWVSFEEDTCYLNDGTVLDILYCRLNDCKIYEFEDVIFEGN